MSQAPPARSGSTERPAESVSARVVEPRTTAEGVTTAGATAEATVMVEPPAAPARPPRPTRFTIARTPIGVSSRLIQIPIAVRHVMIRLYCLTLSYCRGPSTADVRRRDAVEPPRQATPPRQSSPPPRQTTPPPLHEPTPPPRQPTPPPREPTPPLQQAQSLELVIAQGRPGSPLGSSPTGDAAALLPSAWDEGSTLPATSETLTVAETLQALRDESQRLREELAASEAAVASSVLSRQQLAIEFENLRQEHLRAQPSAEERARTGMYCFSSNIV
jgi:hypothetical protein